MTTAIAGVDVVALDAWRQRELPGVAPFVAIERIAGGRSNLAFILTGEDDRRWVLRRPPLGHVLATAHDVVREARIMVAAAGTVPVPRVVGIAEDDTVLGAPFFVMEFVDGRVLRNAEAAAEAPTVCRAGAGGALVEALAALHAADVDQLGLGHLRRPSPYIERQLGRWKKQWDATTDGTHSLMDDLHRYLVANAPTGGVEVLVHSDPKLDNCVLGDDGSLRALLDWELAAIGEPLADLAMALALWAEPGDDEVALQDPPTRVGGFAPRVELVERYRAAAATPADDDALAYYLTFSYWKLAGIVQGVRFRLERAAMGDGAPDPAPFAAQVERLARLADRARSGADR